MKLTSNFSLSELTKSQTAERHGISNMPTEEHIENLKLLCENVLQPVRDEFGPVMISSGYRSENLSEKIGSSRKSQHCRGQAADFECHGHDNMEVFNWIVDNTEFDQGILEFYKEGEPTSGWIHCSYSSENNRNQWLKARREDGSVKYLPWTG